MQLALCACPVVVVGRRTPEIGSDGIALFQHRFPVHVEVVNPTVPMVESDRSVSCRQCDPCHLFFFFHFPGVIFAGSDSQYAFHRGESIRIHHELFACHGIAGIEHRFGLLQHEVEVQHHFALHVRRQAVTIQFHHTFLLCGNVERIPPVGQYFSFRLQRPLQFHVVERLEEVLIVNFHLAGLQILGRSPDVLVVVTHFVGMRIRFAVGIDDTVAVEIMVAGGITAEVASVSIYRLALFVLHAQPLVHEVPDETALVLRILAYHVPIFLESSHGVTHGMSILALDERTRVVALRVLVAAAVIVIHRAEDIRLAVLSGLFILTRTARVVRLHQVIRLLEVRTVTGFVAHAPEDDGRMVLVNLDIAFVALQVCLLISRLLGQRLVAVAHSVAFDIGFGHHIDAVYVAKFIPTRVVGIMTGTHGIDVQLFHHADVFQHAVHRHHIPRHRVEFVTVGSLE